MGGAVIWAEAETKEDCERELEKHIQYAKQMGLEDVRSRSQPMRLDNGLWFAEAWLHSYREGVRPDAG